MKPGPTSQTNEQKKAKGETRPSRMLENVLEFPSIEKLPEPPEWLNKEGVKLWHEMTPMLFKQRVLTNADLQALLHLCQMHGEIVDGYGRRIQPNSAQLNTLRMYFSEFGMTPSSRTRIGTVGKNGKESGFKKNGKKPQANRTR